MPTTELTDAEHDLADAIEAVRERQPANRWLTPSRVARSVCAPSTQVRPVLRWMAHAHYADRR